MTTLARKTSTCKPVTGSVRWITRPTAGCFWGRIAIVAQTQRGPVATEYDLAAHTDKDGRILGYGLAKDDDEVYSIDASQSYGWTCDCGDCQFRQRECKHIRAVRTALAALKTPEKRMQEITGALVGELLKMRTGEVRHVNGHRCERLASAVQVDDAYAISPRQLAELLSQSEPCQRPAPAARDEFESLL